MAVTTPIQDSILDAFPELMDYDSVCYHLYNDQAVGEDHIVFWKRALSAYCLEKGVLSTTIQDVYKDFTLPFVVPGEQRGPFGEPAEDNLVNVNVYPESLDKSMALLYSSKDVHLVTSTAVAAITEGKKGSDDGWFSSITKSVFSSLSPKKEDSAGSCTSSSSSSNTTATSTAITAAGFTTTTHFIPCSVLQSFVALVLKWRPAVEREEREDGGGDYPAGLYYLANDEADRLYALSSAGAATSAGLGHGNGTKNSYASSSSGSMSMMQTVGPMTFKALIGCVARRASTASAGAGGGASGGYDHPPSGGYDHPPSGGSSEGDKAVRLFHRLSVLDNASSSPLCDVLSSYMVQQGSAVLSASGDMICIVSPQATPATTRELTTVTATVGEIEAARLQIQYSLTCLRHAAHDLEGRIDGKTQQAKAYLAKSKEAERKGSSSTTMVAGFTKMAKTQLVLRGQLEKQFEGVSGALLRLESALLVLQSNEMHARVVDSIHNATQTLQSLRNGSGADGVSVSTAVVESVLEAFDDEMEENGAVNDEIRSMMGAGGDDDEDLVAELNALMLSGAGAGAGDGDADATVANAYGNAIQGGDSTTTGAAAGGCYPPGGYTYPRAPAAAATTTGAAAANAAVPRREVEVAAAVELPCAPTTSTRRVPAPVTPSASAA